MATYPDRKKAPPTRRTSSSPKAGFIPWVALGFVCGYVFAWFFSPQLVTTWIQTHFFARPAVEKPGIELAALPKAKFEFYTLLTQEKTKPLKAVSPKLALPTLTPPEVHAKQSTQMQQYMLQLASFQRREDAEHMLAELVMHGFEASIRTSTQQGGAWHRVVMGPFASRLQAEKVQGTVVQRERISGIIRRIES